MVWAIQRAREWKRALVERRLGWASRSGPPGGCPLYGGAFELDDAEGSARDYLTESKRQWRVLLEGLVMEAVTLGRLRGIWTPLSSSGSSTGSTWLTTCRSGSCGIRTLTHAPTPPSKRSSHRPDPRRRRVRIGGNGKSMG